MKTRMDTLNNISPIGKIHADGYQAIIDGDRQVIVGKVRPDEVQEMISKLSQRYDDVSEDADGDIVFYSA